MQNFRLMDYLSNPMEKLASIRATKQRTSYHVYTMRMQMSIGDAERKTGDKRSSTEKLALPSVHALEWCDDLNVSMLGKVLSDGIHGASPAFLFSSFSLMLTCTCTNL